jgi:hypothetical protein
LIACTKDGKGEAPADRRFPTNAVVFAGSILLDPLEPDSPRRYSGDMNGNVISISTFGDEVLCLPGVHGHDNNALMRRIATGKLPPVNTPIILRLKPKR